MHTPFFIRALKRDTVGLGAKEEGRQAKGRSQAHRSRMRQIAGYDQSRNQVHVQVPDGIHDRIRLIIEPVGFQLVSIASENEDTKKRNENEKEGGNGGKENEDSKVGKGWENKKREDRTRVSGGETKRRKRTIMSQDCVCRVQHCYLHYWYNSPGHDSLPSPFYYSLYILHRFFFYDDRMHFPTRMILIDASTLRNKRVRR